MLLIIGNLVHLVLEVRFCGNTPVVNNKHLCYINWQVGIWQSLLSKRMSTNVSYIIVACCFLASIANAEVDGQYTGKGLTIEIHMAGKSHVGRIITSSERCFGEVSGKVLVTPNENYFSISATTPDGHACTIDVGPLHKKQIQVRQSLGCSYFHGAECEFSGTVLKVDD
jgi:hypothetical protein